MHEQERQDLFAELITRHQSELYGYIYAVVRNWQDADDIYQCVCLVLWNKFDLFRPGSSFFAWARQTAKIEVSNFLRHKQSSKYLAEKLREVLAAITGDRQSVSTEVYLAALRHCREKLMPEEDELLELRYYKELNTVEIAAQLQRHQQSISRSLNRIRRLLFECIRIELAKSEHSSKSLP